MWWFLLLAVPVQGFYDWETLHRARAHDIQHIVQDYCESFPCEECREHFNDLINEHPYPLHHVRNDQDAHIWSWLTHNIINERLGKPWESYEIMKQYG